MTPEITLVHDRFSNSLPRYAEVMGRTLADTVKRAAKGVTRRVIAITPPAHFDVGAEAMVSGSAARKYGQKKIRRDMGRVLAPVKLKGRRTIRVVFGRRIAQAIIVKTIEKYPDVRAVLRQHTRWRNSGARVSTQNLRQRKLYVDARKFNQIAKEKDLRIGRLASGFAAAAAALDVPTPAWITRHGRGRGAVRIQLLHSDFFITVINHLPDDLPPALRNELGRRVDYAVEYQRKAMLREVDYYAMKKAQELVIKTRNFSPLIPDGMQGG